MIKNRSIRSSMAALTLLPLLILAILLEGILLQGRYADLDQTLLDRGYLIARQLASSSEYGVFSNNLDFLNNVARSGLREADIIGVMILDADNQVLTEAGQLSVPLLPEFTNGPQHQEAGTVVTPFTREHVKLKPSGVSEQNPLRNEPNKILIYEPILPSQINLDDDAVETKVKRIGAVIVEMSKARVQQHKQHVLLISLGITVACLALTFYVVLLASRRITHPIRQLSLAVQRVAQGDLRRLVAAPSNIVELSTLNQGMRNMMIMLAKDRTAMQEQIDAATHALREKKEQAEQATHQKTVFLAVASHDLRQPLHALGLYAAELNRKLSGSSEQALVASIEQSVDALANLLNALLDISKLDAGALVPHWQNCSVSQIIKRVEHDCCMQAKMKNIHFVVCGSKEIVHSDPVLLERILMNLVTNALRYTPENGCVMIACRKRGKQLRIEVRDNGVGISAEDQLRIFNEFSQVGQTQLDHNKGVGLGLAIVDRLAKLLGHGVELRSKLKQGSVFALHVNLSTAVENLLEPPLNLEFNDISKVETLPLSHKRILVVDDDPLILSSTATLLASWGGEVYTALSFQNAMGLLAQEKNWDLIVSDYHLGVAETGMDIIAAARAQQGNTLEAILISGNSTPALLRLADAAGLHLLPKLVKPAKLRSLSLYLLNEK